MVLLTSSAVSVAISSSVVCLFTFLLFLSGYVLQQQTVRALQEALRQPREPRPVPTLPPQFQHLTNETTSVTVEGRSDGVGSMTIPIEGTDNTRDDLNSIQIPVIAEDASQIPLAGREDIPPVPPQSDHSLDRDRQPQRLAYIFALLKPSDLCAVLLFAKQQRSSSQLASEPSIVLLYPSTWETASSSLQSSALSYMRDVQDLYDLVYHPVQIRRDWDVKAQLLGELQWKHWDYDRALYLRTPGLLLDSKMLDSSLETPGARGLWTPLGPSSGDNPDLLLITPKGLRSPRKEMTRLVTAAAVDQPVSNDDDLKIEISSRDAAYVLLDEEDLGRPGLDNKWYLDLLLRFDQGRRSVCDGSGLLDWPPKADLRRSR
ncbi:hypothetical protein A1O1_02444 [Capronia coronata CBS 617.96]|uniref:Uncharacterized protein n=1 Tax=Capronia coronata CBS 617.96 TaxID=1182541 RepID=W9YXQ3_9EURO|nr:uncharacterized protein A1O1_02444 [Capronia coronata CBS 617.96]EXJ94051.1 hypothetical protein A1O1_02444 [Capronia coronata CBS 617.96]